MTMENKSAQKEQLLAVRGLSVTFTQYGKGLKRKEITVISDLDVEVEPGKIVAIVGSSGSGKSLLAHAILGILPSNARMSGMISYKGQVMEPRLQEALRGREIALIPQSVNFLDPLMRVGNQVRNKIKAGNAPEIQRKTFMRYHLQTEVENKYPFQLSGGMARRVLTATAVCSGAGLIIADEPTPGLHPQVVEETLKHLKELADLGCGVVLITHDIEAALKISDSIAVFYAGTTVEIAPAKDFEGRGERLRHPYTRALWRALPQNEFEPIHGFQPAPGDIPDGCLFGPRCQMKTEACSAMNLSMRVLREGKVRCCNAT